MYGLTKKEKMKFVLEKIKELEISSYEIGKKTGLSIAGIDKLINGNVKNPQENTLNKILIFLENKVVGTNLKENNTQNLVAEPTEVYHQNNENYMKKFSECLEEKIELMKKIEFLKNTLRDNNIDYIE